MIHSHPITIRVVLATKSNADDVRASIAAIERLRGVKHVEQDGFTVDASIDELGLTTRPRNALLTAEILTVKELLRHSRYELRRLKHLGKGGLQEVETRLAAMGARLRPQTSAEFAADLRRQKTRLETEPPQQPPLANVLSTVNRLWKSLSARGYVTQDLHDWHAISHALERHVCEAATEIQP